MATPTREQIMAALFAKLNGKVTGIKTYSRRVTLPTNVGTMQLPALMLYRLHETMVTPGNMPLTKLTMRVLIIVVFRNTDVKVAGDTIINPIIDAIETALAPDTPGIVYGNQTLGGLVNRVNIDGDIQIEPGDTDPQGLGGAVIPLSILVP